MLRSKRATTQKSLGKLTVVILGPTRPCCSKKANEWTSLERRLCVAGQIQLDIVALAKRQCFHQSPRQKAPLRHPRGTPHAACYRTSKVRLGQAYAVFKEEVTG